MISVPIRIAALTTVITLVHWTPRALLVPSDIVLLQNGPPDSHLGAAALEWRQSGAERHIDQARRPRFSFDPKALRAGIMTELSARSRRGVVVAPHFLAVEAGH